MGIVQTVVLETLAGVLGLFSWLMLGLLALGDSFLSPIARSAGGDGYV